MPIAPRRSSWIAFLGVQVGIKDEEALIAVNDGHPAMLGTVHELAQPHHGRDFQSGRDDRGMIIGHGHRPRWRILVRAEGRIPAASTPESGRAPSKGLLRRGQLFLKRLGELALQVAHDPRLDVTHVGGSGRQMRAGELFQSADKLVEHVEYSVLRGGMLFFDDLARVGAVRSGR